MVGLRSRQTLETSARPDDKSHGSMGGLLSSGRVPVSSAAFGGTFECRSIGSHV